MEIFCFSLLLDNKNQQELSYFSIKDLPKFYEDLKKINGINEVIILQKCNCIEFYIFGNFTLKNKVLKLWQQNCLNPLKFHPDKINIFVSKNCIDHLLKTACGLKSVILGDNQVLGQLHKAYKEALTFNSVGPVLTKLFTGIRRVARNVKQKTGIGVGNVSVARSAVDLLKLKTQRKECSVLVIGAGETGSLVAKSLYENSFYNVIIANRTKEKAQKIVDAHYAKRVLTLIECLDNLEKFDVVFFALSIVIDKNTMQKVHFKKDAFIFDLGNPKNTLYFNGNRDIMDINSVREYSEIILLKRKQNIDQAIFLIHQAIPQLEKGVSQSLINIDIKKNFHRQSLPNNKMIFNIEFKNDSLHHIREFLYNNKFIEVQTPCVIAVPSDPVRNKPDKELFQCNWYGKRMLLRQSNQLYKQMLILSGFDKIYEYGPFWRAESNPTPRHLSEAWGLDIELANVKDPQKLVNLIGKILNYLTEKLFRDGKIKKKSILNEKIPIFEYKDIIKLLKEKGLKYNYGDDFGYELEEKLGQLTLDRYGCDIFAITHFPNTIKKFYTKSKGDYTESFDVYYKGWEISSGAVRQDNKKELIKRMIQSGLNPEKYRFYIEKFENTRSHGGFCLGIDRILVKLLNYRNIKDIIIYPRSQKEIIP